MQGKHLLLLALLAAGVSWSAAENACQDLDNCPKAYNNTMDDWAGNSSSEGLVVESDLAAWMSSSVDTYLAKIQSMYPPDSSLSDSPEVFNGVGGRALIYLRAFQQSGASTDLAMAQRYADEALRRIGEISSKYVGFLWGRTGVWCVAAVIYDNLGNATKVNELVAQVESMFEAAVDDDVAPYDDWDAGRGGLLFAARFLQEHLSAADAGWIIARPLVVAVAQAVVDRGARLSRSADYLEWISPNDGGKWLGQSHGSAGVLHGLLDVPELFDNATAQALVLGTLDHIVASQQPSGNYPTEYYTEDEDELVQWDHGAPGVMTVLLRAALQFVDSTDASVKASVESWVDSALKAADCTWSRGIVTKGLMLCHGISGNTYMQLHSAKILADLASADAAAFGDVDFRKYQYRALQFQRFVMQTPDLWEPDLMRQPTPNPYYFYTSSYESAVALWQDLLAHQDAPLEVAGMPAY